MTAEERDQRIAAALAEYVDHYNRGEPVELDAFCARYPDLAADLRTGIEAFHSIDSTQPAPQRLSGLRIVREIGSGGMGCVYMARDESLGRDVAIKVLNPDCAADAGLRSRFLREARSLARVSHPHIVRIYNLGPPEEPPHFVMEYVEGTPLTQAARPLPLRQKIELLHKVILAVEFLHSHQLVHRDLKPANIVVGPDLEPKLLDLGLALLLEDRGRLTQFGEVMGTPDYLSPEQTSGTQELDARSDIFSLGVILFELLTGSVPFGGETFADQVRSLREHDPPLPRRLNPSVPGDLQSVCLKALEKNPADRYRSAREMADDLERYLAGEPVVASPTAYTRMMAGRVELHVRELDGWKQDHVISDAEYDALRRGYDRLTEREDAWIMEARRLSVSQVALYLGAWLLANGAALIALVRYTGLSGTPAVVLAAGAIGPPLWLGLRYWRTAQIRIGLAHLLAVCLLCPLALLTAMNESHLFAALTRNDEKLELFFRFETLKRATNAQLWWSLLLAMPLYGWLRRFTRSSVFSLVLAFMGALLSLATLLRMGMLDWLENDPGRFYLHLLPFALLFLVAGLALERLGYPADSRYFYPIAVVFTLVAFSGVAGYHEPYTNWLKRTAPWTRGQIDYLFIVNAGAYLIIERLCELWPSPQLRGVARAFRFVIPGHVLTPLLLLGMAAWDLWHGKQPDPAYRFETRLFEVILPVVACAFIFLSIPRQMKNHLAVGMLFLAIGIVRLQRDLFQDARLWPIALLVSGLLLMIVATRYSRIRMELARLFARG